MRIGAVVIGRNEGDRLVRCLQSLGGSFDHVVYVDSGSTDGSVARASAAGCEVVELDTSVPFSAARARNAGRERLRELHPNLDAVQVIDGDCELDPHWVEHARSALEANDELAVVWGRRRERHLDQSVYNRLCDLEWDTPIGPTTWFGGDALIRTRAFDDAGGYDPAVIAGEEPDLAYRMRQRGWRIERLACEMTRHDAAMSTFGQWWRRAERAGHAHIDMAARHGLAVDPYNPKGVVTTLFWSVMVPLALLTGTLLWSPWVLLGLGVYDLQALRIAVGARRRGRSWSDALLVGVFTVLAKWPETVGYARWAIRRLRKRQATIIEYKGAQPG